MTTFKTLADAKSVQIEDPGGRQVASPYTFKGVGTENGQEVLILQARDGGVVTVEVAWIKQVNPPTAPGGAHTVVLSDHPSRSTITDVMRGTGGADGP